jgi:glycerol-3-phosphate dehydrogenase
LSAPVYDVAIIGAGVVGCAVAREFSRFELQTILLEANSDLGDEASKGNSAILSSGSDTPYGTLECKLVMRGYERYLNEAPALGLPFLRIGAMTIAWSEKEASALNKMFDAARAAGFSSVELLDHCAVYQRAPHLAAGVVAAMWEPNEGAVDPFSTPYAYALDAVENGVEYRASCPVQAASRSNGLWSLATPNGEVQARVVIHCGGLRADHVEALAGYNDLTIRPRRGQFIVFDKSARELLDVIVKPVPSPQSRGILITPTVFGNVLVGPTAEDVDDRDDRCVTREGLAKLRATARRRLPRLLEHEVLATYAGMRPGTQRSEYRIIPRLADCWVTVAGIRSTGLSAALGIAEYVADAIIGNLLPAQRKAETRPVRVSNLCECDDRPWMDAQRIARDPAYAEIVCHCERVTLGEIRDALDSPIPPRSIKALKRRTLVMFGSCQGFFCGARIQALFDAAENERSG